MPARPESSAGSSAPTPTLRSSALTPMIAHGLGQHRVDDERHRQKRHRTGDDNKEQGEAQNLEHGPRRVVRARETYTQPSMIEAPKSQLKVTTRPAPKSSVELEVEFEPERLRRQLDDSVRHLSRRTKVPGFRPGKVPRPLLERALGVNRPTRTHPTRCMTTPKSTCSSRRSSRPFSKRTWTFCRFRNLNG